MKNINTSLDEVSKYHKCSSTSTALALNYPCRFKCH